MLKATLQDVPLIAGYLHDAEFRPEDLVFDREQNRLALTLVRICYERPEKGRFLFLFRVIRHPWIRSSLVVTGVKSVTHHGRKQRRADVGEPCMLLDIVQKGTTLEFRADTFSVNAEISPGTELLLEDLGEPLEGPKVVDFRRSVFPRMQEMEKLRTDTESAD